MKPEVILHRRNTIEELKATPTNFGVEIDIRADRDVLYLHHDPFTKGEPLEEWLRHYCHGTLVLNVKEAGLEERVLALLSSASIEQFFFLDQPFPSLVWTAHGGERRVAIRSSEFESVAAAGSLIDFVDWVWIDSFRDLWLGDRDIDAIRTAGLKTCLVSPELQGRGCEVEALSMTTFLLDRGLRIDAVCTKNPEAWTTAFDLLTQQASP